jgi:UDP-3-O-[3-hydroxymyristoyl] glucosamine N-acyltransferase
VGDPNIRIERVRTPKEAGAREIAAVLTAAEATRLDHCRAEAILVGENISANHPNQIRCADPRRAFVALLVLFVPAEPPAAIDPRAAISPSSRLGSELAIGPGACIEAGASIGDRTRLGANVFVGCGAVIGVDCRIMPNVTIADGTIIGNRVTIHSGTTIGSDGFGYVRLENGSFRKIPQLGCVEIGDDVEIGANCCIDRATLEKTVIGRGTKIDNLVQIGHNATIGEDTCIVAQVGIAGSVSVGSRCELGGQAGIADHVTIADGVRVAAQSGVIRSLDSGNWGGTPALPIAIAGRAVAAFAHLPEYRDRIRALEARIGVTGAKRDADPAPDATDDSTTDRRTK